MIERVDEKVAVITSFNPGSGIVIPRRMEWRGKTYVMSKLGYHHSTRDGRHMFHIFAVSDGTTDFRLKLDTETLHWMLEEVSDGLAA
jgi:hypothetical protein